MLAKKTKLLAATMLVMIVGVFVISMNSSKVNAAAPTPPTPAAASACSTDKTFFGLPVWYKYLDVVPDPDNGGCKINFSLDTDVLKVAIAIFDIVIRLAALVAAGYVLFGGIKYVISQGEPENVKAAQNTITNALIGLVIAIVAASVISFIGNKLAG